MAPRSRNTRRQPAVEPKLSNALLLNKFMLSLFGVSTLEALSEHLKDPTLEGYDEDNVSLFYKTLSTRPFTYVEKEGEYCITAELLLKYDNNIYRHTEEISRERGERISWKYFQYLSLLFTEIYLDRYFSNREKLLSDIREYQRDVFNFDNRTYHELDEFTADDLNKLAYWSATGSGKTLIMHVNILQFKHYAQGKIDINRTLLVTPNAGLTQQHLDEFALSGISANEFSKKQVGGLFDKESVDVIEITKLKDKDGDTTVAVDSFESNNLVLIDEGHRGSSGDDWKPKRDKLSATGFAFEYSATFGQAIAAQSNREKRMEMLNEYGRATMFDYSYRYFYNDGYGKDYQILNMNDTWSDLNVTKYLIACLLGFYEQTRLFLDKRQELTSFMIEKPLAVFVGSTVSVSTQNRDWQQEMSDVVSLLKFFQEFISQRSESIEIIRALLEGNEGLVDRHNNPIFTRSLRYVRSLHQSAEEIYQDMLRVVFNSEVQGASLHLDNLKGVDGEIGMRIGNAPYFGIINVGDSGAVIKKCADAGISTMPMDYSEKSLFATINRKDSSLNVLIGSKKFSEGWSSWRVSTMGLLNVGRGEGSQIIQLFGRGVRLKGYKYSLKRSSALDASIAPASLPKHISTIETLNIFGIRANYMEQFKMYLQEEGLPTNDSDFIEVTIPVMPTINLTGKRLKYLKVKDGKDFKTETIVDIGSQGIGQQIITLDYYPRIDALRSNKREETGGTGSQNVAHFTKKQLQFLDWNRIFFEIEMFKKERGWYNLNISPQRLRSLAENNTWYNLLIPEYDMEFTDYKRCVDLWQEIVTSLLKLYVERTYNMVKSKWMAENVDIAILDESNANFEKEYRLLLHKDLECFVENIKVLQKQLEEDEFAQTINISNSQDFQALYIAQHLYQPLMYLNSSAFNIEGVDHPIKIAPVALNRGERTLCNDISNFYKEQPDFFVGKQLYLLRNKSRKGIGFFDVHGFYPDFLLWLVVGEKQYISFLDPKGILHLRGFEDPKIMLHKVIREEIEPKLKDSNVILNSYIISVTDMACVSHWAGLNHKALLDESDYRKFNDLHVFFQDGQSQVYIGRILKSMLNSKISS